MNAGLSNKLLIITGVIAAGIALAALKVPFFWDACDAARVASHFYQNPMNSWIVQPGTDNGNIPLFGWYLGMIWTLFGKSLMVSHLGFLIFIWLLLYQAVKLASGCIAKFRQQGLLLIIIIANPVIITQSVIMAYDIAIASFFLWAVNSLLRKQYRIYSVTLMLLCATSVRGIILAFALFIVHAAINFRLERRFSVSGWVSYIPTIIMVLAWLIFHKYQTGWFLFDPAKSDTDRNWVPANMMLRQAGYIVWKLADSGNLVLWLAVLGGLIAGLRNRRLPDDVFYLLLIIIIPLLVLSASMVLISNPIGHRYFIVTFVCISVLAVYFLGNISKVVWRRLASVLIVLVLFSGNFWYYPVRYGNNWDCSLKVIPLFKLERKMRSFVASSRIEFNNVATDFPLTNGTGAGNPASEDTVYRDIEPCSHKAYEYILYSNVSNKFQPEVLRDLETNWLPVRVLRQGQVYMVLYKNPTEKSGE